MKYSYCCVFILKHYKITLLLCKLFTNQYALRDLLFSFWNPLVKRQPTRLSYYRYRVQKSSIIDWEIMKSIIFLTCLSVIFTEFALRMWKLEVITLRQLHPHIYQEGVITGDHHKIPRHDSHTFMQGVTADDHQQINRQQVEYSHLPKLW